MNTETKTGRWMRFAERATEIERCIIALSEAVEQEADGWPSYMNAEYQALMDVAVSAEEATKRFRREIEDHAGNAEAEAELNLHAQNCFVQADAQRELDEARAIPRESVGRTYTCTNDRGRWCKKQHRTIAQAKACSSELHRVVAQEPMDRIQGAHPGFRELTDAEAAEVATW